MSDDIVARLRETTVPRKEMGWPVPHIVQRTEPLWHEAADEIERLRAEVKLLRKREIGGAALARLLPPVLRTQLGEAIQNLSPVGRPEEATDGRG